MVWNLNLQREPKIVKFLLTLLHKTFSSFTLHRQKGFKWLRNQAVIFFVALRFLRILQRHLSMALHDNLWAVKHRWYLGYDDLKMMHISFTTTLHGWLLLFEGVRLMIMAECVISYWFLTSQDRLLSHVCPCMLYGEQSFKEVGSFRTSLQTSLHDCPTAGWHGVRGGPDGWGIALQAGRLRVRFPSAHGLGVSKPLTEISTRNISLLIKAAGA